MTSEDERVALLAGIFAAKSAEVRLGIGDDAAVLEGGLVWTVDAQVEGVHFRLDWMTWEDVGFRATMAAASDVVAMGGRPIAILGSLVLSSRVTDEDLAALARGQAAAAAIAGAPVCGGNLARGGETSITTTVLGRAERPVPRSGAAAGDGVWIAGPVGLAAAALRGYLQNASGSDPRLAPALAAFRRPRARFAEGLAAAASGASAAVDVSDGLARDVARIAQASNVRIALDARAILAHGGDALDGAAAAIGAEPLDLALHGGEDYALVVTSKAPVPGFTPIGVVEPSGGSMLVLVSDSGRTDLAPRGWDHFAT
ncbi:MAG: thiamine-phosphate kinase [Rubrivivax sp.]